MKITELTNLFVGYNKSEDFRVLICALDSEEAMNIVRGYAACAHLSSDPSDWSISELKDVNTHFDCDYVITSGDES